MYQEESLPVVREVFEKELLACFAMTDYEDSDEALFRTQQNGTLREYQKELERLANRVTGWPQKALIRTFLRGLKDDIVAEVRMFKPCTLQEMIKLARKR